MKGQNQRLWLGKLLLQCGIAALLVAAAAAVRLVFLQPLGFRAPYLTFYPAVILAALLGGLPAGLLATVLSAFCASYFFIEPVGQFSIQHPADLLSLAVFLTSCMLVSGIAWALHRARVRAQDAEAEVGSAVERGRLGDMNRELMLSAVRQNEELLTEIAERAQAEEALRESEAKYRSLFENMLDGFANCKMIYDDRGRPEDFVYLDVNSAFRRLTGLDDVVGKKVTEVIPGIRESNPELFEIYGRCALTGRPERFETEVKPLGIWFAVSVYCPARGYFVAVFDNITERKRAEEALKQSEERLRLAQQIAHIGTFEWNIKTGLNTWTPELEAMYGLPPGGFAKTQPAFEELVHPDDRAGVIRLNDRALETGEPTEGEWRVIWPDGSIHWVAGRWQVLKDESGNPLRMTGVNVDITERKRAEEQVQQASVFNEAAMRSLGEGLYTIDEKGLVSFMNPAAEELFGWTFAELHGKKMHDMTHHHYRDGRIFPSSECAGFQVLTHGVPLKNHEDVFIHKDGTFFDVIYSIAPLRDDSGKINGLVVAFSDISERKRVEEELRRYRDSLEEQVRERTAELEKLNKEILTQVQAMPIGHIVWDTEMKVVSWNPAAEKIFGYTSSETLGKPPSFFVPEEARPHVEKIAKRLLEGDETAHSENQNLTKDGRIIACDWHNTPLKDASGNVTGILSMVQDVTEMKRAEEEALRLQKLDSLRVLAGGIAHDLNNMMVAVEANAGLALRALGPDSPGNGYLTAIENAADKVGAFSKQLLSFTGTVEAVKEPISLNEVVKDTVHLLVASISQNAVLEYSLAGELPPIEANPHNLTQVMMNLIINASDALGEEKGTIKVSTGKIHARRGYLDTLHPAGLPEGEYEYVQVSDTGQGMSEETKKRIYEPFFTTKFTGRGLGLSAVFGIVTGHGGAIGLDSVEGGGTTFRVLLPVSRKGPEKPAEPAAKKVSGDIWSGKGTILVVDDEESALYMTKKVLETAGYAVLTAKDGSEAIEIFRKNKDAIAAVLMDLIMPTVRGDEAAKEIRKLRDDIDIILLSGYHDLNLEGIGGAGRTEVLEKPYRIVKLLQKVQEILQP